MSNNKKQQGSVTNRIMQLENKILDYHTKQNVENNEAYNRDLRISMRLNELEERCSKRPSLPALRLPSLRTLAKLWLWAAVAAFPILVYFSGDKTSMVAITWVYALASILIPLVYVLETNE